MLSDSLLGIFFARTLLMLTNPFSEIVVKLCSGLSRVNVLAIDSNNRIDFLDDDTEVWKLELKKKLSRSFCSGVFQ